MKRNLLQKLKEWKEDDYRKPLLLQGARQVGKTFLISEFGESEYSIFIYLNFEQNPNLTELFLGDISPETIIADLSLLFRKKISPNNTLIFFDEIQACPQALTSLKYFFEQAPEYHIIAAGSLLGVSMGKTSSFPVGKVNFLTLYPLSFEEYLYAIGEELLVESLQNASKMPDILHEKLNYQLKLYFYLGGMPEVIAHFLKNGDIKKARQIQNEIIQAYQRDFSKYTTPTDAIKVSEIWGSIPFQLAKENKKFKYNDVKHKARASAYQQSIEWLKNAGLVHVVPQIRAAKLPLAGYADYEKFKIYLLDTGLLGALLKLTSDTILNPTYLFTEYNGAFVENYVCAELVKTLELNLFYWASDGEAEVDFVFQYEGDIIPLEVKSGSNKHTKSLRSYYDKYGSNILLRASPRNFVSSDVFTNVPLYGLLGIESVLKAIPSGS